MYYKTGFLFMICYIIIFLFFFTLNPITLSLTMEDILEGIKHNESLVKNWKGNLIVKDNVTDQGKQHFAGALSSINKNEKTREWVVLSSEANISYSFEGKKFRCDAKKTVKIWDGEIEKEERTETYQAYDGETLSELRISPNGISAFLDSQIDRVESNLNPRYWGMSLWGKPIVKMMESLSPELIGTETFDEDICYVIKLNPPVPQGVPPEKIETYKLWIVPKKGYRLKKIETSTTKELLVTINQFREISPDIWFPYSGKKQWFIIDPNTNERLLCSETTMEIRDSQINLDIPDDVFRIKFEKGTEVYDARTKGSYVVE